VKGGSARFAWALLAGYFALVCVVALSHVVPLTFDEAWSFLEFSRHGLGFSLTHYPLPNNHIAFTALQALVVRESFVAAEPTLLRLGNLLVVAGYLALLLHIVTTRLALRPSLAALAVIALTLCSPLITLYLFVARGYLLGCALLLASVHFGAIPGRRVATAVLCALATWTIPTFAFAVPGVVLALFLCAEQGRAGRRAALQTAALYAALTLVLYAPVLSDVLAQRTGWNEGGNSGVFAKTLWDLLGNAGAFDLALYGDTLLISLLAVGVWRSRGAEALALLAPVFSFLLVAGLLNATGIITTPFSRTASFIPVFVWLALAVAVAGSAPLRRVAAVLAAFNLAAGLFLFAATLGGGDPQRYPMLERLSPSPLARADRSWLSPNAELRVEWDAAPVGRLYARSYGVQLKRVDDTGQPPCEGTGRFPPRPKNRVSVAGGSRLICF
jgi:hypothetical protein